MNKTDMMFGRVAFMRANGWDGELYAQAILLDVMDYNIEVLPPWFDSTDRTVWPEMRAMVDAADYDVHLWLGWDAMSDSYSDDLNPLAGRVAFLRAHGASRSEFLYHMDDIDFWSQTSLITQASSGLAKLAIIKALSELDEWEHDRGDCPKMRFLEDPITVAYGVGGEFIDGIKCRFCDRHGE